MYICPIERRGTRRFFDIFRDCALMGYKLHLVYVIRFIESHYLRLTCNIYIGRIMHSCTLGVCRVTCNRLYRYVPRICGQGFRRFSFFCKNRMRITFSMLRYRCFGKEDKMTKRMQKCSLSRERTTEKGSTPKCNIPRRQTISSEIEITLVEICNALERKK